MKNDCGLPPPVTRNSSRSELWEEIEALRREVDQQQREITAAKDGAVRAENELTVLRYQVAAIRAVLDLVIR